jgi:hypothetical protein
MTAKVNANFSVQIRIQQIAGQDKITLKLVPSGNYGTASMSITEFDSFIKDLGDLVHGITGPELNKGNYAID